MRLIWKRYYCLELLKMMLLFLGCFYFLYVLIDYSAHTKAFQSVTFFDLLSYYALQFTKRAEILISAALLISTIKVLTTANLRLETVALTSGGISLKQIVAPCMWVAFFCSSLLYLNLQFLQPISLNKISLFESHHFKEEKSGQKQKSVNSLVLEDHSLLIYQRFDPESSLFFDLFWLKDKEQIFRIKSLDLHKKTPLGKYVDCLMRTPEGELTKLSSHEERAFPEMRFEPKALYGVAHPPNMQSLTQLFHQIGGKETLYGLRSMNDREAEAATFFYYKLTLPLVCLLAIIGPAPFCLRFTRALPIFSIYALSLCLLVLFFTLLSSALVLGESQVLPPLVAILTPQLLFFLILGWYYAKL